MRLIDADAFKDYIRDALKDMRHLFKDNGEWAEEVTEEFCKDIDEQPTIELPERKRGKWERHYCEDGNPDGWQCDCCGQWFYFGDMKPNFCPNCGADMRERVTVNELSQKLWENYSGYNR